MSKNAAVALLISCAMHVAAFLSFKITPPPVRTPEPRRVELELRPVVEARRGPPAVETKKRAPERPHAVRTSASVVVAPIVEEGLVVAPPGPPSDEPGGESGSGTEVSGPRPPPPDTRAEVLALPRIEYPLEAREDGIDGVVKLWVRLDAHGRVISVEVLEEPGSGLGEAARRSMLRGTFRAATHLGTSVECSFEYLYRFELE